MDEEKVDPNAQYVDLTIKEGQHIRLKVPMDTDPIAYAKEYLQTMADQDMIVLSQESMK